MELIPCTKCGSAPNFKRDFSVWYECPQGCHKSKAAASLTAWTEVAQRHWNDLMKQNIKETARVHALARSRTDEGTT